MNGFSEPTLGVAGLPQPFLCWLEWMQNSIRVAVVEIAVSIILTRGIVLVKDTIFERFPLPRQLVVSSWALCREPALLPQLLKKSRVFQLLNGFCFFVGLSFI